MLPIEVIDLTSDVEEEDLTNESPPVDFSEYICPICLSNPMEPVTTFCGHVFCKLCIMDTLDFGYRACPICKSRFNEDEIVRLQI
nr:E3 ubiquitin-protein ligase RMA1 [Drosophila bipectinata]